MKPVSLKEKVIQYRKQGYSYGMLSEKFGLSKSTLSNWLREIPYKPSKEVLKRIGLGRMKSANFRHKQKINDIIAMRQLAKKEIGKLTKRDLWFLGIGLYMGEGSKLYEYIRVINSDPNIMKIVIKWFRDICGLKNKNFVPTVHTYPDNNVSQTINYWAKQIGISKRQFGKTHIDKRTNKSSKKKRKLPFGTLHLQIKSCGKKEFGKSLHRKIMGWIATIIDQT